MGYERDKDNGMPRGLQGDYYVSDDDSEFTGEESPIGVGALEPPSQLGGVFGLEVIDNLRFVRSDVRETFLQLLDRGSQAINVQKVDDAPYDTWTAEIGAGPPSYWVQGYVKAGYAVVVSTGQKIVVTNNPATLDKVTGVGADPAYESFGILAAAGAIVAKAKQLAVARLSGQPAWPVAPSTPVQPALPGAPGAPQALPPSQGPSGSSFSSWGVPVAIGLTALGIGLWGLSHVNWKG